ncbi:hypothetical protein LHGZ1_2751 [Laribacter hongkongensis]|uniref:Uncharacterized protein n=1 Tax=Laribacter hongkongensis TaxID=168471 RepID=A0A248LLP1_9NEIS|nr:hypothetical protein LHGZ1_2751 [Laribacter hongkongensis]
MAVVRSQALVGEARTADHHRVQFAAFGVNTKLGHDDFLSRLNDSTPF